MLSALTPPSSPLLAVVALIIMLSIILFATSDEKNQKKPAPEKKDDEAGQDNDKEQQASVRDVKPKGGRSAFSNPRNGAAVEEQGIEFQVMPKARARGRATTPTVTPASTSPCLRSA